MRGWEGGVGRSQAKNRYDQFKLSLRWLAAQSRVPSFRKSSMASCGR